MGIYNDEFDDTIFERDSGLKYMWDRFLGSKKRLNTAERHLRNAYENMAKVINNLEDNMRLLEEELPKAAARDEKRLERHLKKQNARIAELEAMLGTSKTELTDIEQIALKKAKTISILESILFAIENWAVDDSPAPDFTTVSQSVLFKLAYEPVMRGVEDYYLDAVPPSAVEVVKRGREYIKAIRQSSTIPITESTMWSTVGTEVQQWWIRDGLSLLYGGRDEDWDTATLYTDEEMTKWDSVEMDQVTHFPVIYDAFQLSRRYGDETRLSSGLPDFTKQTMQTRLTAHE